MEVLKILFITVFVLSNSFYISASPNLPYAECEGKCASTDGEDKMNDWGWVCITRDNGEKWRSAVSACQSNCTGEPVDQNQTECWSNYCRQQEYRLIFRFCLERGSGPLETPDDCENLVCKGKGIEFYSSPEEKGAFFANVYYVCIAKLRGDGCMKPE